MSPANSPSGRGSPARTAPVGAAPAAAERTATPVGRERGVPTGGPGPSERTAATGTGPGPESPAGERPSPRRVRLTVARVDPWSVLKLSFLLSVAVGVAIVVSAVALWSVLDGMGIFDDVNRLAGDVAGDESSVDVLSFIGLGRVVSLATVIAVVDVFLITALATLGAFLYNLTTSLVGGLVVTLSDD